MAINVPKSIQQQFNLFMLTHDCSKMSTVDIYNLFANATKIIITPDILPDVLQFIDYVKDLELYDCIIDAETECEPLITRVIPRLYVKEPHAVSTKG